MHGVTILTAIRETDQIHALMAIDVSASQFVDVESIARCAAA
ncbi:hypothetical protein OH687_34285 [Burkholderia anthina]|nr:hypothetical protein OH687_34285 [Burkholderia anthina]